MSVSRLHSNLNLPQEVALPALLAVSLSPTGTVVIASSITARSSPCLTMNNRCLTMLSTMKLTLRRSMRRMAVVLLDNLQRPPLAFAK